MYQKCMNWFCQCICLYIYMCISINIFREREMFNYLCLNMHIPSLHGIHTCATFKVASWQLFFITSVFSKALFAVPCHNTLESTHARVLCLPQATSKKNLEKHLLIGGWTNPFEKYARQIGWFPQVGGRTKNIWNHHLVLVNSDHLMSWILRQYKLYDCLIWSSYNSPRILTLKASACHVRM